MCLCSSGTSAGSYIVPPPVCCVTRLRENNKPPHHHPKCGAYGGGGGGWRGWRERKRAQPGRERKQNNHTTTSPSRRSISPTPFLAGPYGRAVKAERRYYNRCWRLGRESIPRRSPPTFFVFSVSSSSTIYSFLSFYFVKNPPHPPTHTENTFWICPGAVKAIQPSLVFPFHS